MHPFLFNLLFLAGLATAQSTDLTQHVLTNVSFVVCSLFLTDREKDWRCQWRQ